ncbi:C4-dicarboxylate ABC transporter [Acuticoccus sediminis]|uniref:C4-dicarboxylate ABC transporter n=1 Tax=Acuticoccus sediminis TaxID=2184697 RepID=A0A8B2NSG2_9HYPH|nr:TRAP transporter large permease subunit [Acuticoccus sediminis]RAH98322.1 C4-dicarboxylate ABC transporter [Acuticoccus sediminis]
MIEFIAHNLAPIMFVSVMAMLLLGYPVAFTLAAGGLIFFVIGVELSSISNEIRLFWTLLQSHPERIYSVMYNDTLLAVPFFTFMGILLERTRMAEELLETIGQLFGPVRGGLAFAVILVGALLAATTGVVAASVIAMGLISLPIMMRYGYDRPLAAGTIAASGTLAQIVPPSLVLIVMADQLGRPVGDMYAGALYPSLITVGLYCAYIAFLAVFRPHLVPALPPEGRTLGGGVWSLLALVIVAVGLCYASYYLLYAGMRYEPRFVAACVTGTLAAYLFSLANRHFGLGILSRLAEQVVIVLIPPLTLIFLVLGTIFLGIATPTEGGAMGATGALILAIAKRRLSLDVLKRALDSTTRLSAFVMFILIGARVFGLTFYGINGNVWVEELMLSLPGGATGFLVTVTIMIFILGCFLDFFEIAFIALPLLAPIADKLGIDLIWFGVILGINLQTSFLSPPFGFSLFFLRSVAPKDPWRDKVTGALMPPVKTLEIYKGVVPFILMQFAMIALVIIFPGLVMHYKDVPPPVTVPQEMQAPLPALEGIGEPSASAPSPGPGGLPPLELPGGPPIGGGDAAGDLPGLPGLEPLAPPTVGGPAPGGTLAPAPGEPPAPAGGNDGTLPGLEPIAPPVFGQ